VEEPEKSPSKETEEPAEASLDELIAKKADEPAPEEESEEESMLETGREEKVEALSVKVVPQQPTEFVCKSCFLVKHRSQLSDKKRMYCVDCA
jgi:hypothetical protein